MTGPPIRLASQVHMALPSLARFGRISQLLLVALVSQVSEELEQRSCPNQDEWPCPCWNSRRDRAHLDAANDRHEEIVSAHCHARGDDDDGREFLLDTLE